MVYFYISLGKICAINTTTIEVTLQEAAANASFSVTLGEEAVTVESATANKDNTVYTLVLSNLDGKKGTLVVNSSEVSLEIDYSAEALKSAIDAVKTKATTLAGDDSSANITALLESLKAPVLNLVNIDEFFAKGYADDIKVNLTNTRARLQQAIDRVNAGQKDLVNAVNNALNVTALKTALNNLGIKNVSTTLLGVEYFDAIEANTTETKEQIQSVIDSVNVKEITAAVVKAETEATQANHDAANTLLTSEVLLDEATQTSLVERLATVQTAIDIAGAIVTVNEAASKEDLLAALKDAKLGLENVVDANSTAYFAAFELITEDPQFTSVAKIKDFVNTVNEEEAVGVIDTAIASVNDATDATELLAALKADILKVNNISDRNKEVYKSELDAIVAADADFAFATTAEVQEFVNNANATPVGLVNTAKSTAQMKAAIENSALKLDLAVYNELTSLQKNVVAQNMNADTTEFTDSASVQTKLNTVVNTVLGL